MDEDLKQNLTATDTWVRGLFMVLFLIIYGVAEVVFYLIVIFQFFHTLLTRKPNTPVLDFSENLCAYLYEILLYLSFNSHELPFPFTDWPNERDELVGEQAIATEAEVVEPAVAPVEPAEETVDSDDEEQSEDVPQEDAVEQGEPEDKDKT